MINEHALAPDRGAIYFPAKMFETFVDFGQETHAAGVSGIVCKWSGSVPNVPAAWVAPRLQRQRSSMVYKKKNRPDGDSFFFFLLEQQGLVSRSGLLWSNVKHMLRGTSNHEHDLSVRSPARDQFLAGDPAAWENGRDFKFAERHVWRGRKHCREGGRCGGEAAGLQGEDGELAAFFWCFFLLVRRSGLPAVSSVFPSPLLQVGASSLGAGKTHAGT